MRINHFAPLNVQYVIVDRKRRPFQLHVQVSPIASGFGE
jgi:hypothetical protein